LASCASACLLTRRIQVTGAIGSRAEPGVAEGAAHSGIRR